MRSYKSILLSIAALAVLGLPGYGQNYTGKGSGRTIEENVRRQILRLPRYEVFDQIGFRVDGSTVTLFGKVRNAINKSDAENRVEDIPGVARVIGGLSRSARTLVGRALALRSGSGTSKPRESLRRATVSV